MVKHVVRRSKFFSGQTFVIDVFKVHQDNEIFVTKAMETLIYHSSSILFTTFKNVENRGCAKKGIELLLFFPIKKDACCYCVVYQEYGCQ